MAAYIVFFETERIDRDGFIESNIRSGTIKVNIAPLEGKLEQAITETIQKTLDSTGNDEVICRIVYMHSL